MFLDLFQRLGIIHERKDVAHRGCQANDLLVTSFLGYEHLCELVIRNCTNREGLTNLVHG